jgi:predicted nucleic acid-binding protein
VNAVVVDTNILFSMLLSRHGRLRDVLFHAGDTRFYCCRFSIVELFKHKQKLLACSKLEEPDLLEALNVILGRLSFYDELSLTTSSLRQAFDLCAGIDEKDTPFVALTIELNGELWSGDKELVRGLRDKGFQRIFIPESR